MPVQPGGNPSRCRTRPLGPCPFILMTLPLSNAREVPRTRCRMHTRPLARQSPSLDIRRGDTSQHRHSGNCLGIAASKCAVQRPAYSLSLVSWLCPLCAFAIINVTLTTRTHYPLLYQHNQCAVANSEATMRTKCRMIEVVVCDVAENTLSFHGLSSQHLFAFRSQVSALCGLPNGTICNKHLSSGKHG